MFKLIKAIYLYEMASFRVEQLVREARLAYSSLPTPGRPGLDLWFDTIDKTNGDYENATKIHKYLGNMINTYMFFHFDDDLERRILKEEFGIES